VKMLFQIGRCFDGAGPGAPPTSFVTTLSGTGTSMASSSTGD
jgi:hypothetical protein